MSVYAQKHDNCPTCRCTEPVPDFTYDLLDIDELALMIDVFNSCIQTKTLPAIDSPCQKKIIDLLEKCGREPTAK